MVSTTKIFGIGWAKTGTTTLGKCFEILGFDHQTQDLGLVKDVGKGDLSRIMTLAENKETFEDWPWIILYKELDSAFPNSLFILTKRKQANWIRSYKNMLANEGEASEELNEIRQILYGLQFPHVSESELIKRYEKHNAEVESYFCNRPKDLLIVDWETGSGWEEICGFLGKDTPNQPFPHANKGKYTGFSAFTTIKNVIKKYLITT